MRVLLVQSAAASPWVAHRQWETPSVGLGTIAGQICGHEVKVADMFVWRKRSVGRFRSLLTTFQPQVVGFSAMTFQYESTLRFALLTKEHDGTAITVLGGYHASLYYESIAQGPDSQLWDYLVRGEGEHTFRELLEHLEYGAPDLSHIAGLSYRRKERFVHNPPRPLADLSQLRIPARDKRVARGFHFYFTPADVIETSRGCRHACSFCSINKLYGRSFRVFSMERVLEDIEDAYQRGARHLLITDDNITQDMDHFELLCEQIARLRLPKLRFTTQASPLGFARRPQVVKKMVEAGLVFVFLGIENASAQSLAAMHKPNTLDQIKKGVLALQKEKVVVVAGIINGLPQDDEDTIRENFSFIKDLGIASVMDQLMTPYPNTAVREEMLEQSLLDNPHDFRWYDGFYANVRTNHLSAAQLSYARWKIRREVLGMWRPTPADWEHFRSYAYLWEHGLRQLVWSAEKLFALKWGDRGRYERQLKSYMKLNDFGLPLPAALWPHAYDPIMGRVKKI